MIVGPGSTDRDRSERARMRDLDALASRDALALTHVRYTLAWQRWNAWRARVAASRQSWRDLERTADELHADIARR